LKILKIKILNINSLKGRHKIDFEANFGKTGVFAITGSTGAGKTTILDAISAAIYAKTSRLDNISELMTRHTGEAFTEVEFEIKGKRYRSRWAQHRARKDPEGSLQSADMELFSLSEDKIIETGILKVLKKNEEIIGLDFSRFKSSVMLAQGGFDVFLKAKASDRAQLLEKMTNTEIYALISEKVFDKNKEEKRLLEKIEEQINYKDDNELKSVQELEAELKNLEEDRIKTTAQFKKKEEIIVLKRKINELFEKKEDAEKRLQQGIFEKENKKEELLLLEKAEKAEMAKGVFEHYNNLELRIKEIENKKKEIKKELFLSSDKLKKKKEEQTLYYDEYEKFFQNYEVDIRLTAQL